ncbi:diguanylate cyclase [Oceanicola sp. 22II-s10i]|uniref:dihydroneopterin aldolase n=1 Tax=Oceanicola sp. 22II-s10i TaxID=1317116 RepID=UPI000B522297|nr:dihydroneopterin aldolase [Oceanicola sp. 22II-s10i]OWU85241.1 diguanylate cyclase [Oceanicola sp. 22II-s10i]
MSDRISQAFGHPYERAVALSGEDPLDRISLRDHVAEVEIGAFQAERGTTQRLRFNVVVEVARPDDDLADDVDRILSYDKVTEAIAAELHAERLNLLETLAENIAHRILQEDLAVRVYVRIEKLDRGPGALGVEIVRSHEDAPLAADEPHEAGQHPVVVHLSADAVMSPALGGWLDRLAAGGAPVILTVGLPPVPQPESAAKLAQRRIDLLAIEQQAWVLAGRDRRCVVVNTRTELDWAMKHGQISVWAPSKIVLDAPEGPHGSVRDTAALAAWFAGLMGARELVVVGDRAPLAPVPVRAVTAEVGP